MRKTALLFTALAAVQAYAVPCPFPNEKPEGAEEAYATCGGIGIFKKDGKFGFYDPKNGEVLVKAQFDEVKDRYIGDRLIPVRQGDKWAYVDKHGQAATPYQYEEANHFPYGAATAIVRQNGRYGMIDSKLQSVVPMEYERIDGFIVPEGGDAYLSAACKDGKCGFLNDKGETVIALEYDDARGFGAAVAPVKKGDKWGYINAKGEIVQDFVYDEAPEFTRHWAGGRDVSCVEAKRGGATVAIDPQGKILPEGTQCMLLAPPMY